MDYTIKITRKMVKRFLKRYTVWIILSGLVGGGIGLFVGNRTQNVTYTSSSTFVQSDNNYAIISSYQKFVLTGKFKSLMKAKIDKSFWQGNAKRYNYSIGVVPREENSPFFSMTVQATNKKYTKYLTGVATKVFEKNIRKYLSNANTSLVTSPGRGVRVNNSGQIMKLGLVGFIIGVIITFIVACFSFIRFGHVTDDQYLADVYQIKLLGTLDSE
ncbi:hypothetical protein [Lactiplantibacillus plantarum]|uniref:hypothetical protein n=1 Tax=Lactiplantibacillus plantarum TaxID=1590 RepID=UPI001897AF69|nr:hypothetical protein [Lactiplantibacillus plantarum]MCG0691298.1 polysaccharide biosynthesis protein [Lactiplantibacillus plantarum]MCG0942568.1 polysaccharide biosynthesis protein [Lactiplantibacillus plantarum]MDN7038357.1 hypothetical protein [Lactiplantibacillus plantarum]